MKLDLDELERLTRQAEDGDYAIGDHWAPSYPQILALIARIRELETGLSDAVDRDPNDITASWKREMRAILNKGAALP